MKKISKYSDLQNIWEYLRVIPTCVRRRTLTWRRLWRAGPGLKVQKSDFECGHDDYGHDFYDDEGDDEDDDEDDDEKDEDVSTFN